MGYLCFSRKIGTSITIGDDVTVMVIGIKGNQVRLGIDAPREIAVHREEVKDRIDRGLSKGERGFAHAPALALTIAIMCVAGSYYAMYAMGKVAGRAQQADVCLKTIDVAFDAFEEQHKVKYDAERAALQAKMTQLKQNIATD